MERIFETTNRELEQYFYTNGIRFMGQYKDASFQTVWQYEKDSWLLEVLQMYARYLDHKQRRFK